MLLYPTITSHIIMMVFVSVILLYVMNKFGSLFLIFCCIVCQLYIFKNFYLLVYINFICHIIQVSQILNSNTTYIVVTKPVWLKEMYFEVLVCCTMYIDSIQSEKFVNNSAVVLFQILYADKYAQLMPSIIKSNCHILMSIR